LLFQILLSLLTAHAAFPKRVFISASVTKKKINKKEIQLTVAGRQLSVLLNDALRVVEGFVNMCLC